MTRERRRLLIAPARLADRLPLQPQEAHYLQRVLRLRPGDGLEVVDGAGGLWQARLSAGSELELLSGLAAPYCRQPPAAVPLELAVAVPRHDADTLWRMAAELGADRLQPLTADRQAPGLKLPLERWRGILREAMEQCERLWLPELPEPLAASARLAAQGDGQRLLATTREAAPLLEEALAGWRGGGVVLAIGPEGGWSEAERQAARAGGWQPVALGPTILRTSTAAVAALARLAAWRERLS